MADQKTDPLDTQKLENVENISFSEVAKPEVVKSDAHPTGVMENTISSNVIKNPQPPEEKGKKISTAVGPELDPLCQLQSKNVENIALSGVTKPEVVPSGAHPTRVMENNVSSDVIKELQPTEGKGNKISTAVGPELDPLFQPQSKNNENLVLSGVTKPEVVPSDAHPTGVMKNTVSSDVTKDPKPPEDTGNKISSGLELDPTCQQQSNNIENIASSGVTKPNNGPSNAQPMENVAVKNIASSDVIIDLQPTEGKKKMSSNIVEPKSDSLFQQVTKGKDASEADGVMEISLQPNKMENLVTNIVVEPKSDCLYQKQTENVENIIAPAVVTDPVTNILNPHPIEVKKESDAISLHPEGDKNFVSPSVVQSNLEPLIQSSSKDTEAMKNIVSSQVIDINSYSLSQNPPGDKETNVKSENVDRANDSAQCKENGQSKVEPKESDVASTSSIQTTEEDIHNYLASYSNSTVPNTKKIKKQTIDETKLVFPCVLSPAQQIKQQKALHQLYSLFNLPPISLQQNKIILRNKEKLSRMRDWVKHIHKYSPDARSYKVLHISNLPKGFNYYLIRGLIMLKSYFNVNRELFVIDMMRDPIKQTQGCLIRFARGSDCVRVFKDLLGTVVAGHVIKVKVDIDHKISNERMLTNPNVTSKHLAIIELSKAFPDRWRKNKVTNDEDIAEEDDDDDLQESKPPEKDDELEVDIALTDEKIQDSHNESGEKQSDEATVREEPTSGTSCQHNAEGQNKNDQTVVILGNITKAKGLMTLIKTLVTQKTGKYYFITVKDQEYRIKCQSHEEAMFVSEKINGVVVYGKPIETKLTSDSRLKWTLKRKLDSESCSEDQLAAKRSNTSEDGESADSSATAVNFTQTYIPRQEFHPFGKYAYGLSKEFVEGLGLNPNSLGYTIKIMNLHPDVDEVKLREVFSLAGEITQICYNGGVAEIEYDHPVEVVQAISLFNKRKLFGREMDIRMITMNLKKKPLPIGLESIGSGLARRGLPLKDVRTHMEIRRLQQMLHHCGVFRKELNNDNSPFKLNFVPATPSNRWNLNMSANLSNTSNITAESSNANNSATNTSRENAQNIKTPDDSIAIQALGAFLVSQGLIPANTNCKDSRNILTALQKKPVANKLVTPNPPNSYDNARFALRPQIPNRPPPPNVGPRGPNFRNRYPNHNNRQPNPNMPPPQLQNNPNMTPNFTPNQGYVARQVLQYISANTTGLNMMQNNMAPNTTGPNMMQNNMAPNTTGPNMMQNNMAPNTTGPNMMQNNMVPNTTGPNMMQNNMAPNTTGPNMMQNNMAPNSTDPNMMQNMLQQNMASYFQMAMSNYGNFSEAMAYQNQYGSNVPRMNQNTGSSGPSSVVAQRPPMMYTSQPQLRWDVSSNMIQNTTSVPFVQNPVPPAAAPPVAHNIPLSTYNQSVPQNVNRNQGSQATVSNQELHRQSPGNKNEVDSSSISRGKKSAMLLFKNLPLSVTNEALASKMREVGDVILCEITGEGSAVVRFKKTHDADKCLRLFHRSKVDGQVIEVILVP